MSRMRMACLLLTCALAPALVAGCGDDEPKAEVAPAPQVAPVPEPLPARTIPVLCFHDLGEGVSNFYSVETSDLRTYLEWLKEEGYASVTARDVAAFLNREGDLPEKPILITFDDAWKSARTIAQPMLAEYGYVGVAFVMSASIGANDYRLSWEDLTALADAGWEIGSHSMTHLNFTKLEGGQTVDDVHRGAETEIYDSKRAIEENTGLQVTSLAYPNGNYDTFAMETIAAAGYTVAFSVDRGPADEASDPFCLPRTMIVRDSSFKTFKRVCQAKALRISDLTPAPGERVSQKQITFTGTVDDADVTTAPQGEIQTKPFPVTLDPATRQVSATVDLGRGANQIVLRSGTRVASWLVIYDE